MIGSPAINITLSRNVTLPDFLNNDIVTGTLLGNSEFNGFQIIPK